MPLLSKLMLCALCIEAPKGPKARALVGHLDLGVGLKEADDAVGLEALLCPDVPPKRPSHASRWYLYKE